jgi:hypothetical protein
MASACCSLVARTALRVEGDFVECGVNAGFVTSAILKTLEWNALGCSYLIDTFSGPVLTQYSEEEVAERDHRARDGTRDSRKSRTWCGGVLAHRHELHAAIDAVARARGTEVLALPTGQGVIIR